MKKSLGVLLCVIVAVPSYFLGKLINVIGGPVFAIIFGMILNKVIKNKEKYLMGINYCSKTILQYAVILLGFGLNLSVVFETGKQSLPIIISTITTSLIIAFLFCKFTNIPLKIGTLVGVGSSICGGSAIAATAPVIDANEEEVATAISVIFFYNVIAAIFFPVLGDLLEFSKVDGTAFGIFAGTAINDTSSVTAAASTWDSLYNLGSQTLNTAVTVKLTRTLAIIPITICLGIYQARKSKSKSRKSIRGVIPTFIIWFIIASIVTTVFDCLGFNVRIFQPLKELSKFLIIISMVGIGINTDISKLIKTGGKPLLLGLSCWLGITTISLFMQHILKIW